MKKLCLLLGLLCLSPVAFSDNWGVGVKLGMGENDPKPLKADFNDYGGKLSESDGIVGIEVMHEWNLSGLDKIGVKLGFEGYGENEHEYDWLGDYSKDTETTFALPLSVYYKKDNGVKKLSYFGGLGATWISTELEDNEGYSVDKSKIFPHIFVGAEYRFTQVFALGVEAKYNISAKVKKDGVVLSDRSGFSGALTGRFYF